MYRAATWNARTLFACGELTSAMQLGHATAEWGRRLHRVWRSMRHAKSALLDGGGARTAARSEAKDRRSGLPLNAVERQLWDGTSAQPWDRTGSPHAGRKCPLPYSATGTQGLRRVGADDGARHAVVQIDMLDLDIGDFGASGIVQGRKDFPDVAVQVLALGQQLVEFVFAERRAQRGLGQPASGPMARSTVITMTESGGPVATTGPAPAGQAACLPRVCLALRPVREHTAQRHRRRHSRTRAASDLPTKGRHVHPLASIQLS